MPVLTIVFAGGAIVGVVLLIRVIAKPPEEARGRGWKMSLLLVFTVACLVFGARNAVIVYREGQSKKALEHGRELVQRGAITDAEAEFKRATELDPDNKEAADELAKLEEQRKRAEQRAAQGSGSVSSSGGGGGGGGPAGGGGQGGTPAPPKIRTAHPQRVESQIVINDYDLVVDLDLTGQSLEAEATLKIRSKKKKLKTFQVALSPECKVQDLTVNGQPATHTRTGDWLEVKPKGRVVDDADLTLVVKYTGFGGGSGQSMLPGGDIISEKGSYLRPESRWYPAIGFLEFRSPVAVRITVPKGQYALGQGKLVSKKELAGGKTAFEYSSSKKTAGICIATGKWKRFEAEEGNLPVSVLLWEQHAKQGEAMLKATRRAVRHFSELFGEFPYEKLTIAEVPVFPGGYSPASLALLGEPVFDKEGAYEEILAHEVAHQWWGNLMLPQGEGAGWLAEGFAEYGHIMHWAHIDGDQALRDMLWDAKQQYYLLMSNPPEEPILETDPFDQQGSYIGVIYSKGAYILHMLRSVMGDDAFFAALRDFLQEHRYDVATIDDLKKEAAKQHGADLEWFFEQWIERTGTMLVAYDWSAEELSDGTYETTVVVEQQTDQPYRMPIDIQLVTATDRPLTTEWLSDTRHEFKLITKLRPRDIDLDPRDNLLMAVPKRLIPMDEGLTPTN